MSDGKNDKYTYIHKIELHGKLELLTPLHIGSGSSENTDLDILLDAKGKPYIPGTSIAGVVRSKMKEISDGWDSFFGVQRDKEDESEQSQIIFFDSSLITNDQKVKVRDGIRINNQNAIVAEGAKFDYQILEPGDKFQFKVILRYATDKKEDSKKFIKTLEQILTDGKFQIGANTNNGFGQVRLLEPEYKIYEADSIDSIWDRIFQTPKNNKLDAKPETIIPDEFQIVLTGKIENSLIIGDTDPESESDKTQIRSNNKPVITGSSLKGVIRSRLIQILNTISKTKNEKYYRLKYGILGYVAEELNGNEDNFSEVEPIIKKQFRIKEKVSAIKGRLKVSESEIKNPISELQHRIKIDRFTGGTIESALFDSQPVFANENTKVTIHFKLNKKDFPEWEEGAGLLMLVLKDLWTGMLAIGGEKNVGRGRLIGEKASISWKEDNKKIEIQIQNEKGKPKPSSESDWNKLNQFVKKLNEYLGEDNGK